MEITFDIDEYPQLKDADMNEPIKIKGEGRILSKTDDGVVVDFNDMEVIAGNRADREFKRMSKIENHDIQDDESDDDEF